MADAQGMRPLLRTFDAAVQRVFPSDEGAGSATSPKPHETYAASAPAPAAPTLDYSTLKVTVAQLAVTDHPAVPSSLARTPPTGCVTTDPREMPIGDAALKPPASPPAFRAAFADAFVRAYLAEHPKSFPDPRTLALRLAQAGLESAQGTHLYCFNFGGTKAGKTGRLFYASTFEGMPPERARALVLAHPSLYSIDKTNNRFDRGGVPVPNKDGNVMVRFARAAKGASFAAFADAADGASAFLTKTAACANAALHRVDTATPRGAVSPTNAYRDALVAARYFTGDTKAYARQLAATYDDCLAAVTRALRHATRASLDGGAA